MSSHAQHKLNEYKMAIAKAGAGALIAAISAIMIRRHYQPCIKKCSSQSGDRKKHCIAHCKIVAEQRAILYLKRDIRKCQTYPDPQKCQNRMIREINYRKAKIQKIKNKFESSFI